VSDTPKHRSVRSADSKVELAVLDPQDKIDPLLPVEGEWLTVTVLAIPDDSPTVGQGRHLHTSPLAAPAACPEQQRGVVHIGHWNSSLVDWCSVVPQELSNKTCGLLSSQALIYEHIEDLLIDLYIVLLL
jgi:hypothetical protein